MRLLFNAFTALQNGRAMIVVKSVQPMEFMLDMSNIMLNSRKLSKTFTTIIDTLRALGNMDPFRWFQISTPNCQVF